ncbi:YfiT family bacillithiol transferase [Cohnella thailandensis]|uniref:Putative metal-dependent hydrolase H7B67_16000 n=1 Tax=Cohnella thailandensis TaxID=557557 RepID=A0A841SUP0_9BACL|nr:bacillithiol transferase BstA [Cohnella thailandensis]MBB6635624.1 bacillithiol transferase BstA [Cohnella thailandensis]MBP1975004.1 putative damage-inducible protein DinB [Cohnella thailandensis]
MDSSKYPIGKFEHEGAISADLRRQWIGDIERLPAELRAAVAGLTDEQLDTSYRDGGWTLRQVVHHVADSHSNSLTRFKLALTEPNPTIKPYEEADWAELADGKSLPVEVSLVWLEAMHTRWVALLNSMTDADFARTFYHPGSKETVPLERATGMYSWHGRHHTAHIAKLRERMGW